METNKSKDLPNRLAALWLASVHCSAAVNSLAWRSPLSAVMRDAIATVSEIPGVADYLNDRISERRAYLAAKGHKLPE